ncbi:ergosterol biosynthesis ERG4/ERG24 family-domain-containing protein [Dactylonectria estremocensis]|uniref:7-dehydrocholesterol reductase n=1 Tax=Dactylonectria estremocensis TaxID=1079267 RepID=A0A9P9ETV9_9HYPO|nr:ergosterol biosynthesis ERG4/ERG24 family-domain-containing protein [Dactylonectria estremocensis]
MDNLRILSEVPLSVWSTREHATSLLLSPDKSSPNMPAWGRSTHRGSSLRAMGSAALVCLTPLFVAAWYISLTSFGGSLFAFLCAIRTDGFVPVFKEHYPHFTLQATLAYVCWLILQATLYLYLPGKTNTGQRTPAGHLLSYRTNGVAAWIVTRATYMSLCYLGILDPAFIPRNWGGLVAAMNLAGLFLAAFSNAKAHIMPSHPNDRKFSGSAFYDFYMGVELNPRIGRNFDFKLFVNGRPGIIAWTLIDVSNMAYQYQIYETVSPSIILVTTLHAIYVLDFFIHEAWYLRTIDIAHDHFGFYLAWGSLVWLPTMYTVQSQYLGLYPTAPSAIYLTACFAIGLGGYTLFRLANNQKGQVRRSKGHCLVWGKPAAYIKAPYWTTDGVKHESILVCSGWWGWSRHANYVGDLLLSTAMCALVGTSDIMVWFYAIFMLILLVHRCLRDEERCRMKYGRTWEEYCKRVPWRLVPGIW